MIDNKSETSNDIKPAALDRLRDRTDELELIISSLTIFALFSLPGWLFDQYADIYMHLSVGAIIASSLGIGLLTGFCYVIGACFVIHLMARAYWVGLIGLRTTFPNGINWGRTGSGPLTRAHYRATLPTSEAMITATDRFASSLFAIISMITLAGLWFGAVMLLILVPAGIIGAQFGASNAALVYGQNILLAIYLGAPLLTFILDGFFANRAPALQKQQVFIGLIATLRMVSKFAYPSRLILPVKLTLQSNTRPFLFTLLLVIGAALTVLIGTTRLNAWQNFTLSGEFDYFDELTTNGQRSVFYEDTASSSDRFRGSPRLTSFEQSGSLLRVFLPYHPLRDNLVLDQICPETTKENNVNDCLKLLWTVSIAGKEVDMSSFMPAERYDVRMRGLIGAVPLDDLEPGIHFVTITWNPSSSIEESRALGDRYQRVNSEVDIPFLFNPTFERSLQ